MRIIISLFLLYTLTIFGQAKFDLTPIFPSDINQYPLLFLNYSDSLYTNTINNSSTPYIPKSATRIKKIRQFIEDNTLKNHLYIYENEQQNFSTEIYKYCIKTKLVEVYLPPSDGDRTQVNSTKKFACLFYVENRQNGETYKPYIDPKPYATNRSTNDSFGLPFSVPSDNAFFSDLANYISRLNNYGADSVLAADLKIKSEKAHTKSRLSTGAAITLGAVIFTASYAAIRYFVIGVL